MKETLKFSKITFIDVGMNGIGDLLGRTNNGFLYIVIRLASGDYILDKLNTKTMERHTLFQSNAYTEICAKFVHFVGLHRMEECANDDMPQTLPTPPANTPREQGIKQIARKWSVV